MGNARLLETRNLACGYQGRPVLAEVSLVFCGGTVTGLLGPNGSGKSTLLRTLSKTLPRVHGEVRVLGRSLDEMGFRELAREVAIVPQEEEPRFGFLVREVVAMGRLPHSTGIFDTVDDRRAAEEAMRLADCLDLADRPITELSAGERQRVLIARALAQRPRILLLDEPFSHLDIAHQIGLVKLLRSLAREGRAVLAALHDLNLASRLADQSVVLAAGRVVASGPTDQVMMSEALEDAYGVHFERSSSGGRLLVHPTLDELS